MTDAAVAPELKLSETQKVIYNRLRDKKGDDVAISVLYCAAFGVAFRDLPTNKTCQMALGSRIASMNKQLLHVTGERIVPGRGRRTYRLDRV